MEGPMPYVDCSGEPPLLDDKEEVAQVKELWEEVIVDSKDSTDHDDDDDDSHASSITSEDLAAYHKQAFESGGFDVDSYPGFAFGMITPCNCSEDELWEECSGYAEFAIKEYNQREDKNFKVVGIEKANIQLTGTFNYYITFQAVDEKAFDDQPKVFQAKVAIGPKGSIVKLCRQKGDPSEGYSRVAEV